MIKKIELYLISGFLGSGKTTFLKQLLEQTDKKVGVIVNEFGSVGIDGKVLEKDDLKMVEINNGSIFCSCLKGDFVKTLVAFLEQPIEVLFVESSGMADPSSMQNLLEQLTAIMGKKPEIEKTYDYKGSICLIDANSFLDTSEIFQPTINQVRKSSVVILNKLDQVSKKEIDEIHNKLYELNDKAYIYDTMFGKVPINLIDSKIKPEGIINTETTNTVFNRPLTFTIQMNDKYDIQSMKEFSLAISNIALRIKGFFIATNGEVAHADCVGDYIKIDIDDNQKLNTKDFLKIVLIGKNIEEFENVIKTNWKKYFKGKELCIE